MQWENYELYSREGLNSTYKTNSKLAGKEIPGIVKGINGDYVNVNILPDEKNAYAVSSVSGYSKKSTAKERVFNINEYRDAVNQLLIKSARPTLRHIWLRFGRCSLLRFLHRCANLPQSAVHILAQAVFKHTPIHTVSYVQMRRNAGSVSLKIQGK